VVFDTVGNMNLDHSFTAAASHGIVVTTAARSTHDLSPMHNKGLSLHAVSITSRLLNDQGEELGAMLKEVAKVVSAGQLKPLLDSRIFNLTHVSEAHALLESGQANGKIVVTVCETH